MRLKRLSRFNPGSCDPELLERTLVAHRGLLRSIENDVRDAVATGAGHQWLLVGPRGAGKTHLLAVLRHRVVQSELRVGLAVAYMKEEERGVASFLDLLVAILRSFERHDEPPGGLGSAVDGLHDTTPERAEERAEELLLEFVGERRLLLLSENLSRTFAQLGEHGQAKLRDLIQQHPRWTIVATTQALFPAVQAESAPFHRFFKIRHLPMLALEEAIELLCRLARESGRDDLRRLFRTAAGRGRLRALHELSSGNPRLLVLFSQLIGRQSVADLTETFLDMVEELTAYYQEQRGHLPPVQDKIVEALCEAGAAIPVKEIARRCFVAHQTAAKELQKLTKRGFVQSTRVGRLALYELREPLMRISSEVKANVGHPLRVFVDFLGRYYTVEELERRFRSASFLRTLEGDERTPSTLALDEEREYVRLAALEHHGADEAAFSLEDLAASLGKLGRFVEELVKAGDFQHASRLADAAIAQSEDPQICLLGAIAHRRAGDAERGQALARKAVEATPDSADAWSELGESQLALNSLPEASESFARALELDSEHPGAVYGIAIIELTADRFDEARRRFERLVAKHPRVARAWNALGGACVLLGDLDEAARCVDQAIELEPSDGFYWRERGTVELRRGADADARRFLERAFDLDPDDLQTADRLGRLYLHAEAHTAALTCFQRVVELAPSDPNGWANLGRAEWHMQRHSTARDHWRRAVQLGHPGPGIRLDLAAAAAKTGHAEEAARWVKEAVAVAPEDGTTWAIAGGLYLSLGRRADARAALHKAVELGAENARARFVLFCDLCRLDEFDTASLVLVQAAQLDQSNPEVPRGWAQLSAIVEFLDTGKELLSDSIRFSDLRLDRIRGEQVAGERWLFGFLAHRAGQTRLAAALWTMLAGQESAVGNADKARDAFQRAVNADPEAAGPWLWWAEFELGLDEGQSRVETALAEAAKRSSDADSLGHLARLYQRLGRTHEAIEALEQALELDPTATSAQRQLAELLRTRGRYDEAIAHYRAITEREPSHPFARFDIALAELQAHRYERALRALGEAVAAVRGRQPEEELAVCVATIGEELLSIVPDRILATTLGRFAEAFRDTDLADMFASGMLAATVQALAASETLGPGRLQSMRGAMLEVFSEPGAYDVPIRWLDVVARFLPERDVTVLLELPLEERRIVEDLLKTDSKARRS